MTAALLEEKAPKTVDRLWDALPVDVAEHARWSGNAGCVPMPAGAFEGLAVENQVSFCCPGSVCLIPDRGVLLFAYGQSQARTEAGNVWATLCGTVEGDTADFFARLAESQRRGRKPISIRRLED